MLQLQRNLCLAVFTACFVDLIKGASIDTSIELLVFNQKDSTSSCTEGMLDKYDRISLTTVLKNVELNLGPSTIGFYLFTADNHLKTHNTDGLLKHTFPYICSGKTPYGSACKVISAGHYEITFQISVDYTMSKALMQTVLNNNHFTYRSNKIQLPTVYDPSNINFYVNNDKLSPKECEIVLPKTGNITLCCGEDTPTPTKAAIYHNHMLLAQSEKCVSYTYESLESFNIFGFQCSICETTFQEITCHTYDSMSDQGQEEATHKNNVPVHVPTPDDFKKVLIILLSISLCVVVLLTIVVTVRCFFNKNYSATKERKYAGSKCFSRPRNNKITDFIFCCSNDDKESLSRKKIKSTNIEFVCDKGLNKKLLKHSIVCEDISIEKKESDHQENNDTDIFLTSEFIEDIPPETKSMVSPGDEHDKETVTEVEIVAQPLTRMKLKLNESIKYLSVMEQPTSSACNYDYVISLAEEKRHLPAEFESYLIDKNTDAYKKHRYGKNDPDALKTVIENEPIFYEEEMFPLEKGVITEVDTENKLKISDPSAESRIHFYDTLEKTENDFLKYYLDTDIDLHSHDLKGKLKRFFYKRQDFDHPLSEVKF